MSTRQKRLTQETSSQPTKKPLLDVQTQKSASKSGDTSQRKAGAIFKPNRSITNAGVKHCAPSTKTRTGKERNNCMPLFLIFLHSADFFYIEANVIEIDDAHDATTNMSVRLSDYQSTLITSAPPQSLAKGGNQLCLFLHRELTYSFENFHPITSHHRQGRQ